MITSLVSCSIRKHIPEDKMILKNNVVEIHSQDVDFTKSDISPYIIQSSNPKFLGIMPLTWLYYKTENKNSKLFPRDKLIRMAGNSIPVKLLEGIFLQVKKIDKLMGE